MTYHHKMLLMTMDYVLRILLERVHNLSVIKNDSFRIPHIIRDKSEAGVGIISYFAVMNIQGCEGGIV